MFPYEVLQKILGTPLLQNTSGFMLLFLLKKSVKYFTTMHLLHIKLVYVVGPSISLNFLFRNVLRVNCHIEFQSGSINFLKQRKQPVKYQNLVIAPLGLPDLSAATLPNPNNWNQFFVKQLKQ